jgi:hypothetical protein
MSIIYSVVPLEQIFQTEPIENSIVNSLVEMDHLGSKVLAVKNPQNKFVIQRVISTNLKDYLNPQLQPGREF